MESESLFSFGLFNLKEDGENENLEDIDLKKLLKDNYNNVISLFNKDNYCDIGRPLLVIFHDFRLKDTKLWIDRLYEVALTFQNSIHFAVTEHFDDVEMFCTDSNELFYMGFDANVEPYVFAIDAADREHQFTDLFTVDALTYFCKKLAKNEVYRSDPIPTEQDPACNVEIIVADNFWELVEWNEKDVLVTLHSDYTFEYEFDLWGAPREMKAHNDTLVFYGINAYTNYIPLQYRVSQYPTSFFIKRSDKSKHRKFVHTYFEYYNFKKFIEKNMSAELQVPDRKESKKEKEISKCDNVQTIPDEHQKKLFIVLKKLTTIIERKLPCNENDENGFFKFLDKMLNKVSDAERDNIKVELITLASKRVNEVLAAKANTDTSN